jgi:D-alanyl-lipoteichoic acid acyltransferase DltB (MBOAT superfamily)
MNFTEFSFWWLLFLIGLPLLGIRCLGKYLNIWSASYDRIGLMVLSLTLFWNAAHSSFFIFAFELVFNYVMVRLMQRQPSSKARVIAAVTIAIDIAILVHFKYLDFFVRDVFGLATVATSDSLNQNIAIPGIGGIPPGISFYTFQMVAFVVDSIKAEDKKPIGFIDYVNFASFFPQVVAGPIERRSDLFPQIESFCLKFSSENIDTGLKWLVLGMFMKLVLGDNLAPHINLEETANAWSVWLSIYLFGLRIYFDFAGYSFIALGLAKIIGVQLSINFLAPYISQNIQEFWRRWHVTLSTWFRDYIFIPLGGSRVRWTALNLLVVFTISGLWHGAGWNFIFWGGYHGLLLVGHRYINQHISLPKFLSWALTLSSVMFGWLFFMETNSSRLLLKLQTLISPSAYSISNIREALISMDNRSGLVLTLVLALLVLSLEHIASWQDRKQVYRFLLLPWSGKILLALVILLAARSSSQFVYFAF